MSLQLCLIFRRAGNLLEKAVQYQADLADLFDIHKFRQRKDMPFTPFQIGPGAAIKALTGRYFSLTVFGIYQVIIDLEPLIRILSHDDILHRFTHTYIGAFAIGLFTLFIGTIVCQWLLSTWNACSNFKYLKWLQVKSSLTWFSASTGAFIGTFSHVALDSIIQG
ncbi:hypothetical protein [Methylomonas rhizoryzae]|uniref:hypothetical protein n=1 Tax=Methylomonas rhizoryzae TaxID=2608981 RepID=UPI0012319114|nr:hypothetical protein [Methylomonas rhizoryzae]